MAMHGLYVTAERAALPNIVSSDDLTTANALDRLRGRPHSVWVRLLVDW